MDFRKREAPPDAAQQQRWWPGGQLLCLGPSLSTTCHVCEQMAIFATINFPSQQRPVSITSLFQPGVLQLRNPLTVSESHNEMGPKIHCRQFGMNNNDAGIAGGKIAGEKKPYFCHCVVCVAQWCKTYPANPSIDGKWTLSQKF